MRRDDVMQARLQRWAAWLVAGDTSGYPQRCTLDPEWRIPPAGMRPAFRTAPGAGDAPATHQAVRQLSHRLQHTLLVVYVHRKPLADQARELECDPRTVQERVARAHRQLHALLLDGEVMQISPGPVDLGNL